MVVARRLGGGLERLFEADMLELLAPGRLVAVLDQVLEAEAQRVDVEAPGDVVEMAFEREDSLG